MSRRIRAVIILSVATFLFFLSPACYFFSRAETADTKAPKQSSFVPNQLLVKFQPWADEEKKLIANSYRGKLEGEIEETGFYRLSLKQGNSAIATILHLAQDARIAEVELNYQRHITTVPNDPLFASQWALARIGVESVWDIISAANNPVTIAIVDTGVDLDHPDLAEKIVPGYNFLANNETPMDDNGHGTHVAGIAAAVANNQVGIAGISWPGRIMPIKVLDANGVGNDYTVAQGIIWAADHGANIINLSFGGTQNSSLLEEAINYALKKGALVVAAAGNEGGNGNPPFYPAALEGVIAVGATDQTDQRASFSGYGGFLDICAPGVSVFSTIWDNSYGQMSGTSMAAPLVSGAISLVLSLNPALSLSQIKERIEQTADDLGEPGRDDQFGYGRLNLTRALNGLASGQQGTPPVFGEGGIKGRVVSEQGYPLVGVKIETAGRVAFSDLNGNFSLSPLPYGIYHLTYFFAGYYPQKQEYITVYNETAITPTAVLTRIKGEIKGRVVDQRRRAISGAAIRIGETVIPTDTRGWFRFTLVTDGIYTIYYDAAGYRGRIQENIVVAGGPLKVPTVVLSRL